MKFAIVAVGYNRPDSMDILLNSICQAEYDENSVDLIVSIDKGNTQSEIISVAEKCKWPYGNKTIRAFPERQGLRKHIIQCGDLTDKYDAVVVLEDDLVVSKWFFNYIKQAVTYYGNCDRIAGISLYKHQTHPGVYRPFEPVNNGYDVYMQQFAMSWGQCWTKKMWKEFKAWYDNNEGKDLAEGNILPSYISRWNKQSWLKYYMRYIVETNKYFVYPYFSLSTNASDAGEHCRISNNDFQVPLMQGKINYRMPCFDDAVKYDVFFERMDITDEIFPELKGKKILDLYGNRNLFNAADYAISTASLPYKVVRSIQLKYRPIEMNCISPVEGEGIYIYDLKQSDTGGHVNIDILTRYDVRAIHWKKLLHLGWAGLYDALRTRITRRGQ